MSKNDESFESIPRKSLTIPITRSKFLSAVAKEMSALSERIDGKRVMELSELGSRSDEELKPIIPLILPR
jgi:hypothetical protein